MEACRGPADENVSMPTGDIAETDHPGGRAGARTRSWGRLVTSLRIGQAVITVVLTVVGVVRSLVDGVPMPGLLAIALAFLGWYGGGLLLSSRTDDRALAAGWLLGLTVIWLGAVALSPEFV